MVIKRTSHMRVAHRHRPNSQQQLHEVTNARRPTCIPFETMQNGDNYVKDGHFIATCKAVNRQLQGGLLSPTACPQEAAMPSTLIILKCELQFFVSHNGHMIRCHSKLSDLYFAHS